MKFLFVFLIMILGHTHASTRASCELIDGFYQNSPESIQDIQFETVVDIFSINNAKALLFKLEGVDMKFLRSSLSVGRQTKMTYTMKKNDKVVRAINLILDRTPREVSKTKEFYGNMIISGELQNLDQIYRGNLSKNLVYNFYCRF